MHSPWCLVPPSRRSWQPGDTHLAPLLSREAVQVHGVRLHGGAEAPAAPAHGAARLLQGKGCAGARAASARLSEGGGQRLAHCSRCAPHFQAAAVLREWRSRAPEGRRAVAVRDRSDLREGGALGTGTYMCFQVPGSSGKSPDPTGAKAPTWQLLES